MKSTCGVWLNVLQMVVLTVAPKMSDESTVQSSGWEKPVQERVSAGSVGALFRTNACGKLAPIFFCQTLMRTISSICNSLCPKPSVPVRMVSMALAFQLAGVRSVSSHPVTSGFEGKASCRRTIARALEVLLRTLRSKTIERIEVILADCGFRNGGSLGLFDRLEL